MCTGNETYTRHYTVLPAYLNDLTLVTAQEVRIQLSPSYKWGD